MTTNNVTVTAKGPLFDAPDKVIEAIRAIVSGRVWLSPVLSEQLLHRMVGGREDHRLLLETLTDRELEVFELIGRGFTTRETAQRLQVSHKTIEAHREHVKSKLSLRNAAQLTRRAVQWVEREL